LYSYRKNRGNITALLLRESPFATFARATSVSFRGKFRMKKTLFLAAVVLAFASFAMAANTVCTFDTFTGGGTVPDGYCNITWGGSWTYYDSPQPPYNPSSGLERVYAPNTGAGEYSFTLSAPGTFLGAYFAGYGFATLNFNLYDSSNNLLWTSASLSPSGTPTWLASGYSGAVSKIGVYSLANDFYVMDDVTYNPTPEPGTLGLLATGAFGAFSVIRRRFAK
jgi:hypothetical protein